MVFLNYINALRATAIFFIIALHTLLAFSWDNTPEQRKFVHILYGNGTAIFIFISGYLFQHLSSKFDTKRYYLSKLKYVLLPYFLISLPLVLYYVFISPLANVQHADPNFLNQPSWLQFIKYYWWGIHLHPMWFIPTIAIIYFTGPLLIRGDRNNMLYWLLPIFVLASFIVHRSSFYPANNFVHFFSIYVLGMLFSKYKYTINPVLTQNRILILLAAAFISICFSQYFSFAQLRAPFYMQKIVLTLLTLGLLIKFAQHTHHRFISVVANTSFGVFFLHAYLIEAIKLAFMYVNKNFITHSNTSFDGNIFAHFLLSVAILFMSIQLVLFVKSVMGSKTYLLIGNIPNTPNTNKN